MNIQIINNPRKYMCLPDLGRVGVVKFLLKPKKPTTLINLKEYVSKYNR